MRAVLFDLDGVLIESAEAWFQLLNAAARAWRYPAISRATFRACYGQGVAADQEKFYPRHSIAEIDAWLSAHFMEHVAHVRVTRGAREVLAALAQRGVACAVVSNTPNPLAREVLAWAGLAPEVVVGGNDVPRAKPAPDMMFEACARLGVAASEAWVVGDSRFDFDAARAAGCRFAGIGGVRGEVTLHALTDVLALPPAPAVRGVL